MGPGYGEGLAKMMGLFLLFILFLAFALGATIMRGCDYVRANYSVKIEKKT